MDQNSENRLGKGGNFRVPRKELDFSVDLAVTLILQDDFLGSLRLLSAMHCAAIDPAGYHPNPQSSYSLRSDWTARAKAWLESYPDGGPKVDSLTSLGDFNFGTLFLQYPESAVSLWILMQAFYALDRFVCSNSPANLERAARWETLSLVTYLDADRVKKAWRVALRALLDDIRQISESSATSGSRRSRMYSTSQESPNSSLSRRKDEVLRRIDGIFLGIVKLEVAQNEFAKIYATQLPGVLIVDMLSEDRNRRKREIFDNSQVFVTLSEKTSRFHQR
ncbi:hypothetical protein ACEPPN_012106 [Leptodophora sp. 'Broadleaf-Isolate-01']